MMLRISLGKHCRFLLLLPLLAILPACISSPALLDDAVISYDKSITESLSKQLLLNIARAQQHQPMHFSGISNIAATFNFQLIAGASPAYTGNSGSLLVPTFGGSISENPTISIVPMEGEEFTRRLLTPLQESKLTMLLRQGTDIDLILRLLIDQLRITKDNQESIYQNNPVDRQGYRLFRQAVLHLSAIQDHHALHVKSLLFDRNWTLPATSLSASDLAELQQDFTVNFDAVRQQITLSKRVTGHIILSNYDPSALSNTERQALQQEADNLPVNEVLVDIRAGYPFGELPLHGALRLRSFHNVLNFIGQGITEQQEYTVSRNPLTPEVRENPAETLGILLSPTEPDNADLSVKFAGSYYAIKPDAGYQWNREGFRLLYQVFQMTMSELSQQGAPSITISK
jgi:hypothetical protein